MGWVLLNRAIFARLESTIGKCGLMEEEDIWAFRSKTSTNFKCSFIPSEANISLKTEKPLSVGKSRPLLWERIKTRRMRSWALFPKLTCAAL